MLSEDKGTRDSLDPALLSDPRFQLLDQRLDFDDFDALLSYCACFVGNDSGPKHLASLRGSNVVSLHTARINWGEWGQELTGTILHRQVPCAGCHVYNDPEECGRDIVCVTNINVDEVWGAMQPLSMTSEPRVQTLLSVFAALSRRMIPLALAYLFRSLYRTAADHARRSGAGEEDVESAR